MRKLSNKLVVSGHKDVPLTTSAQYLSKQPSATIYHSAQWRNTLACEYGFQDATLIAKRDGDVCGLLPLVHAHSPLGSRTVSMPASMYGGPVADDVNIAEALLKAALRLSKPGRVLRIKSTWELQDCQLYRVHNEYDASVHIDGGSANQIWEEKLHSSARRAVRRSLKHGVRIVSKTNMVTDFYRLYFSQRKKMCLPAASLTHIERIIKNAGGQLLIALVNNKPIAGLLYLADNFHVHYALPAANVEGRSKHAIDSLLWKLIEHAAERGFNKVCLGGSGLEQTGLRRFKQKWGAVESPIFTYTSKANRWTEPGRAKQRGIWLWNHLPDAAARGLGPKLISWFA